MGLRRKRRTRMEEVTRGRARRAARSPAASARRPAERSGPRPRGRGGPRPPQGEVRSRPGDGFDLCSRLVARLLSAIAPLVTGSLLFAVRLVAAVPSCSSRPPRRRSAGAPLEAWTPPWRQGGSAACRDPTAPAAFVGVAAAVALGASQFADYRGVAIDASAYAGELGATAPVPITDKEAAGSAHLWIPLPLAAVALCLVLAAYRRPRLAGAVAICGVLGLAVAIAIDLPQGLDSGRAGIAFSGSEARLLEGFWAEVSASAALMLSGALLALYLEG